MPEEQDRLDFLELLKCEGPRTMESLILQEEAHKLLSTRTSYVVHVRLDIEDDYMHERGHDTPELMSKRVAEYVADALDFRFSDPRVGGAMLVDVIRSAIILDGEEIFEYIYNEEGAQLDK